MAERQRRAQLLAEKCGSCVLRPGNLMHLSPGRLANIIGANLERGTALICHLTLSYGEHPEVGEAVCRGYYDAYGRDVVAIRVVEALGGFDEIPPPDRKMETIMNRDSLVELLAEGMHTAFRKATDCPQAMKIHQLISEMPEDDWAAVVEFVADPLIEAVYGEVESEEPDEVPPPDGKVNGVMER